MKHIILLCDYLGRFGSKVSANPYRSGMDLKILEESFHDKGYTIEFLRLTDIDRTKVEFRDQVVLYTSSEDRDHYYKSYIEDVIHALSLRGALLLPSFSFLRAHDNKVFMEMLRDLSDFPAIQNIRSFSFGSLEELNRKKDEITFPCVIKTSSGAKSRGVGRADTLSELMKVASDFSSTRNLKDDLIDIARSFRHKGYQKVTRFRKKFIVQNMVPNLTNDWKVLVFGHKAYILYRATRDNDFRASGSGKFMFNREIPEGILDYAHLVLQRFDVPCMSMDIAFDGKEFYLIEFQALYFGTTTLEKSPFYFLHENGKWTLVEARSSLEKVYVEAIDVYLTRRGLATDE